MVTDEIKPAINDNFVGRKVALWFGTTVVLGICHLLWMVGRFGCARVPYVPARQVAVPAAVVAGITGVCGVLALAMSAVGILMLQQGNLGGADFIGLGVCGLMPVTVGFGVAELLWPFGPGADGGRARRRGVRADVACAVRCQPGPDRPVGLRRVRVLRPARGGRATGPATADEAAAATTAVAR